MDSIRLNTIELPNGGPDSVERGESTGGGFADELGKAVERTDQLQLDADHQADQVAAGNGNLHETALALEKADISMRLLTRVRNKLVDAYQEIMRMSV